MLSLDGTSVALDGDGALARTTGDMVIPSVATIGRRRREGEGR